LKLSRNFPETMFVFETCLRLCPASEVSPHFIHFAPSVDLPFQIGPFGPIMTFGIPDIVSTYVLVKIVYNIYMLFVYFFDFVFFKKSILKRFTGMQESEPRIFLYFVYLLILLFHHGTRVVVIVPVSGYRRSRVRIPPGCTVF
jgi:hypothetical protein